MVLQPQGHSLESENFDASRISAGEMPLCSSDSKMGNPRTNYILVEIDDNDDYQRRIAPQGETCCLAKNIQRPRIKSGSDIQVRSIS